MKDIDTAMAELAALGIFPDSEEENNTANVNNISPEEIQIVSDMERITGIKFSDEQKKILTHKGNACIIACAGSGKTSIITNLIAKRIMTRQIKNPDKLICTTYSKGGATEMEERLHALLQKFGIDRNIKVVTMHAWFYSIIRTFGISLDVIEDSERNRLIREAAKEANFELRDDDLMVLSNLISYQVNNLMSDKKALESQANTLDELTAEKYAMIRGGYAKKKAKLQKLDFDDMQMYLYKWLVKDTRSENENERAIGMQALQYCKYMWDDFFIDEAQDISKIQFAIIKEIITEFGTNKLEKSLIFVGDDDQCLIEGTKVLTDKGLKNIEDIQVWDYVVSGIGFGETKVTPVDHISKRLVSEKIVEIKTKQGRTIRGTKNHIGFARIVPRENEYYTYLMYRHDFGFRIGTTSGVRAGIQKGLVNGIEMRLMQERSDKIWVLKVCDTKEESLYWEAYFAYKYSIPMYRFVTSDSGKGIPQTTLSIDQVKRLHNELNTKESGLRLLSDLGMYYEYPHRVPQAEGERCRLSMSMFSSSAKDKYGVHKTELSVNTSDSTYVDILRKHVSVSERTSKTKYNYFNGRLTTSELDEHLSAINGITEDCKNSGIYLEVTKSAKLTDNKYLEMPFGNMIKGMMIPVEVTDEEYETHIEEDEITEVNYIEYNGYVYDLSVPETRNFIANGVVVHNCIYQWRGADPSIILNICNQFDMPVLMLSTNYRCKNEIVDFAARSVGHNSSRYAKSMKAFNQGGNVKVAVCNKVDLNALTDIAFKHIKKLIDSGEKPSNICVMSRNNFHLALLSNRLLHEGIYTTSTADMKLTNSAMYKDIKTLMSMCIDCWDANVTRSTLWKICRFMSVANAGAIASFQDSTGLNLKDTLGYVLKYFDKNSNVTFERQVRIPLQAEEAMRQRWMRLSSETTSSVYMVWKLLSEPDRVKESAIKNNVESSRVEELYNNEINKTIMGLFTLYIESFGALVYKREDKARSIKGLCNYMYLLLKDFGYSNTMDFLRITEQYEHGSMAIPGDKVTLTTVHSAKGKEWTNVIAFACDDISMPSMESIISMLKDGQSIHDISKYIDEERRLYYVEMTRAKENLLVITYNTPSVFLMESLEAIKNNREDTNIAMIEYASQLSLGDKRTYDNIFNDKVFEEKVLNESGAYHYNQN